MSYDALFANPGSAVQLNLVDGVILATRLGYPCQCIFVDPKNVVATVGNGAYWSV
jgi:hypothetical protein